MLIVTATAKDLDTLRDLDMRCYFYPVPEVGWSHALLDSACVVNMVKLSNRPLGYSIVEPLGKGLRIHRLGVLKKFRGIGVAKRLLHKAEDMRRDTGADALTIMVPEIHCLPGDPDDVSGYLKSQGFLAYATQLDAFRMYGRKYDGIIFKRGPQ
ncbi:MAG: hypothetical protein A2Z77_00575 [Chloroflexi bacterium RBG_13_51_36]|nr:MAG: hypothetical protein A2Z77_00575 [Chloroflexi bacterium RBG_13_51_36]